MSSPLAHTAVVNAVPAATTAAVFWVHAQPVVAVLTGVTAIVYYIVFTVKELRRKKD